MAESPGPATTGRSLVQQSTEQDANSSYPSPSHPLPLKRKKKEPGAPTLKNVVVLRSSDVRKREGKLLMPYTTEMSAIKKSPKPRFKKLEISSSMTQCDVQAKLEEIFPYLQQQRFHFAKAVEGGSRLELYGEPSIWDGHLIKQRLTGNSVLYILTDEENDDEQDPTVSNLSTNTCSLHNPMATTGSSRESDQVPQRVDSGDLPGHVSSVVKPIQCSSGYGTVTEVVPSCSSSSQQSPVNVVVHGAGTRACMNNATEGDQVNEETLESQNESQSSDWRSDSGIEGTDNPFVDESGNGNNNSLDLGVTIYPQAVPLQGGQVCWFDLTPNLPQWLNSATATFGELGTIKLSIHNNSLIGRPIPARSEAGSETVILRSEYGVFLGQTEIQYYDEVQRTIEFLVGNKKHHRRLFQALAAISESPTGDGQISGSCGSTQPLKTLKLSVYAAAKFGAKRFLKTVFESKAGRKVFNAYKDHPPLPEVIAWKYGHEETANYLEDITIRFSREANIFPEEPQEIDWQELIALSEEAKENQELCIACDDENHRAECDLIIDTGYLADTETSSSTMSSPSPSDSEIDDTGFRFKEAPSFKAFDLKACRSKLAEKYRRITPVPSSKVPAVEWSLVRETQTPAVLTKNELTRYWDLFTPNMDGVVAKRILVQGPPGIGKTTFTRKLAYDWAAEIASEESADKQAAVLRNFELLITVNLKDVSNFQSLQDVINHANIFADENKSLTEGLLHYITNNQEKVLFVFDGYEEYRCRCDSEVYEIFRKGKFRNCCVLLTSRMSEADELREFNDLLVEISGVRRNSLREEMTTSGFSESNLDSSEVDIPGIKVEPSAFQGNFVHAIDQQFLKEKKQGVAPGCPKEEVTTVVKKLQDLDDHAFFDNNDEMHRTDLHFREREEENDSPMRNDDSDDTRERGDNCKSDRKGDDHSTTTKDYSLMTYSQEQLNYFSLCYVLFDLVPVGLRRIFKNEWYFLYKTSLGEWNDTPKNGRDFCDKESRSSRRKNGRLLSTILNGDTAEWDCTCLFFAVLHSDSIGKTLSPAVYKDVDDIRQVRNEIAHITDAKVTDADFQASVDRVINAFTCLGLSITEIQEIKKKTTFPMEELEKIKKQARHLQAELYQTKRDLQEKESRLQSTEAHLGSTKEENKALTQEISAKLQPFCILSSRPPHEIIRRSHDIERIISKMEELYSGANEAVSTVVLSGNPGCGKSQLAREIGQQFFSQRSDDDDDLTFVATLNTESVETLADSYITFGRHLGITEYALTSVESLKREKPIEAIQQLHRLVLPNASKFTKWLIIADNVIDLRLVRGLLPQTGSKEWGHGQVLITTQDSITIPQNAPHTYHESLSKGMRRDEAVELLEKVSQISEQVQAGNVAELLDFQPLALAAAAYYVQTVVSSGSSNYAWKAYLQDISTYAQRNMTETVLANESSAYAKTTMASVEMAIQRAVESDEVLRQTYSFLSVCAHDDLPLETVLKFVKVDIKDQPEVLMKATIVRSSLLLVHSEIESKQRTYLRLHKTVHEALKRGDLINLNSWERDHSMAEAVKIFNSQLKENDENYELRKKLRPHCESLVNHMTSGYSLDQRTFIERFTPFIELDVVADWLGTLATVCEQGSYFSFAKLVVDLACSLLDNVSESTSGTLMKASIFNKGGTVHNSLGEYNQAKQLHEKALVIRRKICGEHHADVATSYNDLASVYNNLGEYNQAKELHEKALVIRKKIFGEDHADVARSYNNLAIVYHSLGEYNHAQELHEKALVIHKKIFGEDHASIATSYNNLALVYDSLGEYNQAKDYYEKALVIRKKIFEKDHGGVATRYNNLALVYHKLGECNQAK